MVHEYKCAAWAPLVLCFRVDHYRFGCSRYSPLCTVRVRLSSSGQLLLLFTTYIALLLPSSFNRLFSFFFSSLLLLWWSFGHGTQLARPPPLSLQSLLYSSCPIKPLALRDVCAIFYEWKTWRKEQSKRRIGCSLYIDGIEKNRKRMTAIVRSCAVFLCVVFVSMKYSNFCEKGI